VEKLQFFVGAIHEALIRCGKLPAYERLALRRYHLPQEEKKKKNRGSSRGGGMINKSSKQSSPDVRRGKHAVVGDGWG